MACDLHDLGATECVRLQTVDVCVDGHSLSGAVPFWVTSRHVFSTSQLYRYRDPLPLETWEQQGAVPFGTALPLAQHCPAHHTAYERPGAPFECSLALCTT